MCLRKHPHQPSRLGSGRLNATRLNISRRGLFCFFLCRDRCARQGSPRASHRRGHPAHGIGRLAVKGESGYRRHVDAVRAGNRPRTRRHGVPPPGGFSGPLLTVVSCSVVPMRVGPAGQERGSRQRDKRPSLPPPSPRGRVSYVLVCVGLTAGVDGPEGPARATLYSGRVGGTCRRRPLVSMPDPRTPARALVMISPFSRSRGGGTTTHNAAGILRARGRRPGAADDGPVGRDAGAAFPPDVRHFGDTPARRPRSPPGGGGGESGVAEMVEPLRIGLPDRRACCCCCCYCC